MNSPVLWNIFAPKEMSYAFGICNFLMETERQGRSQGGGGGLKIFNFRSVYIHTDIQTYTRTYIEYS